MEVLGILFFIWFVYQIFFGTDSSEIESDINYSTSNTYDNSHSPDYNYKEEIGIKLAMSLAMIDGKLKKSEATTINKYMRNVINKDYYYDSEDLKKSLNQSLIDAKSLSEKKKLKTSSLCNIASDFDYFEQFEVLQLCLDVMTADGRAEKEELIQIDKIADKIGIHDGSDNKDYLSMRDRALISLKPANVTRGDTIDEKLGIKKSWTKHKKLKFIIESFAKWNARMTVVKTDAERKNIQNMLNLLSDAHEKYS